MIVTILSEIIYTSLWRTFPSNPIDDSDGALCQLFVVSVMVHSRVT